MYDGYTNVNSPLCGHRVAAGGQLVDDDARRTADRGWGDSYNWVPVPDQP